MELLVVLAVAAGLVTMAMPSFQTDAVTGAAAAALNQTIGAVSLAQVSRCAASDTGHPLSRVRTDQCLGRDQWHQGALIFQDPNQNGRRETGETVLSVLTVCARAIVCTGARFAIAVICDSCLRLHPLAERQLPLLPGDREMPPWLAC